MKLILASASPRRRELLSLTGYDFEVITSEADENIKPCSPDRTVEILAKRKASAVSVLHEGRIVIGADTVVACDGVILGKPKDKSDAEKMLSMLSGKTHCVYTGVCITDGKSEIVFSVKSDVTFYLLEKDEIESYVSTGEPMDKAGAYGIQGKGALLVEKIDGDYFNIVGLPVAKLKRELKNFINPAD